MSDKVTTLYREGKIDLFAYDTYILFGGTGLGGVYLKNMLENIALEESPLPDVAHSFVWLDGRRSSWRNIKLIISKIDELLEGKDTPDASHRNFNPYGSSASIKPLRSFEPPLKFS